MRRKDVSQMPRSDFEHLDKLLGQYGPQGIAYAVARACADRKENSTGRAIIEWAGFGAEFAALAQRFEFRPARRASRPRARRAQRKEVAVAQP
jgi:hypothetical protein